MDSSTREVTGRNGQVIIPKPTHKQGITRQHIKLENLVVEDVEEGKKMIKLLAIQMPSDIFESYTEVHSPGDVTTERETRFGLSISQGVPIAVQMYIWYENNRPKVNCYIDLLAQDINSPEIESLTEGIINYICEQKAQIYIHHL